MAAYKTCEIRKRFSDLSSSSSSGDDDSDLDFLSSTASQNSISGKITDTKQVKTAVQRLPTRRPDPNVSNRNALLARENRRKKKVYLETLEKELDSMKYVNKKLHKTLRKHIKLVKKLQQEKQYYKRLVSNQSGILDLVSVLNCKETPMENFSPKQYSCSPTDSNRSSSSSFEEQPLTFDFNDDNGSDFLVDAPVLSESFINDFNLFTDSDYAPYSSEANWDQLLGMSDNQLPDEASGFFPNTRTSDVVRVEHDYFQSPESGVCLHLAEGTVSLENCLNCDKRSCSLPDQLLEVD